MQSFTILLVLRRHVESFAHLPYCFKEAAFKVHVAYTCYTRSMRFSKNVDVLHSIPYEPHDFSEHLLEILKKENFDFVLFVDEPSITAVYSSQLASEYSQWLPFPLHSEIAKAVGSKDGFHAFMESNGLQTPRTYVVDDQESIQASVNKFRFPCVIKASEGSSGNAVFIVKSQNELDSTLNQMKKEGKFLVQEFIPGQTVAATFLAVNGVMKCHIIAEKTIALNSGKGPTVAARFVTNENIREMCRKIAKAGNITGITGLDIMVSDQGCAYGIDPHFGRMTTHAHFGPYCGIHFGHMLRECLEGNYDERKPEKSSKSLVKYPEFLSLAFQGGLLKLFTKFPMFSKDTYYLIKQPNETFLALLLGVSGIFNGCRCVAGSIKAILFRKLKNPI